VFHLRLRRLEDVIGGFLDASDGIPRIFRRYDQLVQLQLQGQGIPVLCRLNKKHHEEGHDGNTGVDHQLPCVAIIEDRPVIAQTSTTASAVKKVTGFPETRAVASASRPNQPADGCGVAEVFPIGRLERIDTSLCRGR
jgi:hypothetical protein